MDGFGWRDAGRVESRCGDVDGWVWVGLCGGVGLVVMLGLLVWACLT